MVWVSLGQIARSVTQPRQSTELPQQGSVLSAPSLPLLPTDLTVTDTNISVFKTHFATVTFATFNDLNECGHTFVGLVTRGQLILDI